VQQDSYGDKARMPKVRMAYVLIPAALQDGDIAVASS